MCMRVYISALYNNFSLALNKVFDVRYLCSLLSTKYCCQLTITTLMSLLQNSRNTAGLKRVKPIIAVVRFFPDELLIAEPILNIDIFLTQIFCPVDSVI